VNAKPPQHTGTSTGIVKLVTLTAVLCNARIPFLVAARGVINNPTAPPTLNISLLPAADTR
jgi:hypothetical protein